MTESTAATPVEEPSAPVKAAPITACLLHADYHVMTGECWDTTTAWYFDHAEDPPEEQRAAYQGAVERRILDVLALGRAGAEPAGAAS